MDHLHIKLPESLKAELKKHCRDRNIAVTSAIIMMIVAELREGSLTGDRAEKSNSQGQPLGFILRQ